MVKKLIAAVVLLGANLSTIPVHAALSPLSLQRAGTVTVDHKLSAATSTDGDTLNLNYAKGVLFDAGKIMISPLHWDSTDWLKAGEKIKSYVGKAVLKENKSKLLVAHLSIIPQVGKDMTGMSVKYSF